jgi:hypothetical protein
MLVCVFTRAFAHETAGAARTRHSPLPLWERILARLGQIMPRDREAVSRSNHVIARSEATKQSILSLRRSMDCFASLAMTFLRSRHTHARHHPRMRVIQYSRDANDWIETTRRTGCPACAGHDSLGLTRPEAAAGNARYVRRPAPPRHRGSVPSDCESPRTDRRAFGSATPRTALLRPGRIY